MITIVGAGPVGNYLAYLFSKQGKEVRVVEEHKEIGKPIQCAGIVTSEFEKIVKHTNKFLINKIKRARIYSTKKNFVEMKLQKENLVIDRSKLDFYLHEKAKDQGTKYFLGERFEGNTKNKIKIGSKMLETDYIIGADGPFSSVAKHNDLLCNRKFVVGSQIRAKIVCEKDLVEFYPGIGCFGWVIPESEEVARVGVVSYSKPNDDLNKLIDLRCKNCNIIDRQGGFIPIYNPKQILKKANVLLVGDAATQVKSTSFGGLVPGMLAAEVMSKDIKKYGAKAKKKLHKDLYVGLLMRKIMDRFSEKEFDDFIKLFGKERLKRVLEENDRDFPTKFMFKLALAEPRLLKYVKKLVF
jgi:digeranylgeranylglycerophospholipid reductase